MRKSVVVTAGLLVAAGSAFAGDKVAREGAGDRRADLNAMELNAPPVDVLASLSGWQNTEGLGESDLDGKVVVLMSWANWYPTSHRAIPVAQRIHEEFAGEAVVIGVHHPDDYDGAAKLIERRRIAFPVAHDADGELREALQIDQDPDFYVLDRAGNLRYADIETGAVAGAVAGLVKESRSQAAAVPGNVQKRAQMAHADARRGHRVSEKYLKALNAPVPFELPEAQAYTKVSWPDHNDRYNLNAEDFQGKPLPEAGTLETMSWIGDKPDTKGKIVVVDFWATWCGPCKAAMPMLDRMQESNQQTLAIIGVGGQNDPEANVRSYLKANKKKYYNAYDADQAIYKAMKVRAIPHVAIMSTDGVIRWQGNPHHDDFQNIVNAMIKNDPGVLARLEAREAYLEEIKRSDQGD